jgi:hypothetical protein
MVNPANASQVDRRPKRRAPTLLPGVVMTFDGSGEYDCTVRDLSDSGARITISNTTALLGEFYLLHVKERTAYRARMAWRVGASAGVQFARPFPLMRRRHCFCEKLGCAER